MMMGMGEIVTRGRVDIRLLGQTEDVRAVADAIGRRLNFTSVEAQLYGECTVLAGFVEVPERCPVNGEILDGPETIDGRYVCCGGEYPNHERTDQAL
jgi:hypothetical protein